MISRAGGSQDWVKVTSSFLAFDNYILKHDHDEKHVAAEKKAKANSKSSGSRE